MVRVFLLSLFTFIGFKAISQVDSIPAEARSFILPGYEPLDFIKGDLNNDKRIDAILLLKQPGEDSSYQEENLRPFILLIRQPDGKLKQVLRNDHLIMCRHCGGIVGDPYASISDFPGGFEINFYGGSGWRWGYTYRFSYKPLKKGWYLVEQEEHSFQAGDPENNPVDITIAENELGVVSLDKFSSDLVYEDSKWKVIAAKTFFYDNPQLGSKPRKGYLLKGNKVTGIRHLKNFIEVSYDNGKGVSTSGFILKKDLIKVK